MEQYIDYETFEKTQIHVGTITAVEELSDARIPAYVLDIDFGPLGTKRSSAQITDLYRPEDLEGKQVFAVTNLEPKQVGKVVSECLVLGVYTGVNEQGDEVVLATPDQPVRNGLRLL